ncbi:MAG TPA: hypothetical protein VNX26_08310 [Candidatus Acidoferrum sp.]|nr:hypothetical protein [Candidatus Acidoferrum sp.]
MPFVLAIALSTLVARPQEARSQAPSSLVSKLEVSSTRILPLEPVQAVLRIQNNSRQPITINASWEIAREIRTDAGKWETYYPDAVPIAGPSAPHPMRFLPGQARSFETYFDSDSVGNRKHAFSEPGSVYIRVSIGTVVSEAVRIEVLRPTGADAQALDELRASGLARYFAIDMTDRYLQGKASRDLLERSSGTADSERLTRIRTEQAQHMAESQFAETQLRAFLGKYPASVYSKHAELALGVIALEGTSGDPDRKKARAIFEELRKRNQLFDAATFELGLLEGQEGNQRQAATHFQELRTSGENPFYRAMASRRLQQSQ